MIERRTKMLPDGRREWLALPFRAEPVILYGLVFAGVSCSGLIGASPVMIFAGDVFLVLVAVMLNAAFGFTPRRVMFDPQQRRISWKPLFWGAEESIELAKVRLELKTLVEARGRHGATRVSTLVLKFFDPAPRMIPLERGFPPDRFEEIERQLAEFMGAPFRAREEATR